VAPPAPGRIRFPLTTTMLGGCEPLVTDITVLAQTGVPAPSPNHLPAHNFLIGEPADQGRPRPRPARGLPTLMLVMPSLPQHPPPDE
jgi:hypothetical protein